MSYIENAGDEADCLFCRCAATADDRRDLVLRRGDSCFVMLNAYPYASGHLMVAPFRHVGTISDLERSERDELLALVGKGERALDRSYRPQGFNMGINLGRPAGAGVLGHLHAHLVPRWTGDTNFMTAVAETRVVPEALDRTYERLDAALRELDAG